MIRMKRLSGFHDQMKETFNESDLHEYLRGVSLITRPTSPHSITDETEKVSLTLRHDMSPMGRGRLRRTVGEGRCF